MSIILIIFRCRYQSCESLPSQILDLCTVFRLTIVFKNRLCIKQACMINTMQQGRRFQLYYAHYLSYYSNYFDSLLLIEMDTKRCSAGAAGSTNFPCVACNKGSCRKTVIDDWSSAVCQVSSQLFALFYFYFNYFSNYTRYFKSRKWDSLQNRAPLEGAEAAYLHSSSGTINAPCPIEAIPRSRRT